MRKLTLLTAALCSFISIYSQTVNLDLFKNLKPRSIGPAGMSGRVTSIDAVVTNPDIIYIGTASGGVWKTENGGTTWSPIFDKEPLLNIGCVTIQQSNPSVIWTGTGEGNPRNSINLGAGIYRSLDAGKSWKLMGLEKTRDIHRIIIDPTDPNTLYVAAIGNPYSEHPERGVYKTTDGGESWKKILYTNDTSGCADLVMDPSNPNKLIADMWQHRRTPYSFNSGGKGSGIYMTLDAGKTWKKLGKEDGLPEGDLGRVGLAIAPSDPSRVYALVEATKNGLYKSDDGGSKWELVNSDPAYVTLRAFYFNDIRVDPKNENRLFSLFQQIAVSEDAGKSFKIVAPDNKVHADHHAMWISPIDPSLIIEGGDGGLSISRDKGKTWRFEEQLPLGQFYHVNVDNQFPYRVMGGMQDNNSWNGPGYTFTDGGIKNSQWQGLGGGDGFDVAADIEDPNWVYFMSQGGELGKYNMTTGERVRIKPPAPDLNTRLRFNWNAALALDPLDAKTIYYGSQFLHKSTNKGMTWEIVSPDLTTNNKEQQKQDENGGLSIDITGAENYNTIICIAPSFKDRNIIWVGTDDGNVQLTKDGGKTWNNFRGKIPGLPVGAWIPQIRASQYNASEAFVVANDYRRGDFRSYIFRTHDYGATWQKMLDGNNIKGYALCVLQDPVQPNLIFAGTEHGLWMSFDDGKNFQQWKNDYPSVSTYDLAIQEREADLAIATFGRSMYIVDDIRPLRKLASSPGIITKKGITAFQSPDAYQMTYRNKTGYNTNVWGMFEGTNKSRGAEYSFYVNPAIKTDTAKVSNQTKNQAQARQGDSARNLRGQPAKEDFPTDTTKTKIETGRSNDSVMVRIFNDGRILIRTYKVKADSGLNRYYWGFESKGIRQPGSPKPKPNSPEPTGLPVPSGLYKMIFSLGAFSDSTMIVVKDDPNIPVSREIYDAKQVLLKRLQKSTEKLTAITDQLTEGDETIKKVESALMGIETKSADSIRKISKSMTDSIKNIRDYILGKKQEKQGTGTPYQLTAVGRVFETRFGIAGKNKMPDSQEVRLVDESETLVRLATERTNSFFNNKWKQFQTMVENAPVKLFKDYKPLE